MSSKDAYLPINQFHSVGLSDENETNDKLILKVSKSTKTHNTNSLFNCVTMVDLNVFSGTRESEIDMETNFIYVDYMKPGLCLYFTTLFEY